MASSGGFPPSRRSSMLPPRAPSATGAPPAPKSRTSTLMASLASTSVSSSKPLSTQSDESDTTDSATIPAAGPPPSRPRAAVSEALKRTPSNPRHSVLPASVPPLQSRTMRPMGSISSIREVCEDERALEDLQEKLRDANESLSTKSDAVVALEAQILQLEESLGEAVVEVKTKTSLIKQLQLGKQSSDADVSDLKARFQQVQAEHSRDLATLESAREKLRNADKFMTSQAENIKTLEAQIETLYTQVRQAAVANQKWFPGIAAFQQWMRQYSIGAGIAILDHNLSSFSSVAHDVLVHNALLKVHSQQWTLACENAQKSLEIQPSAMGYIVKALAQIGMAEMAEGIQTFDLVFANCNPNETKLLLLIKAALLFIAGQHVNAISRVHGLIALSKDDETLCCYTQVIGRMHFMRGDYETAVQSLERGRSLSSSCTNHDLESLSLIFGWSFDGLQNTIQRYHCQALHAAGRPEEAAEVLLKILQNFGEEIRGSEATPKWVTDLKEKCTDMLEMRGDTALASGDYSAAIVQYSSALSLDPPNKTDILIKRSKAWASKEAWGDALADANDAIKIDPSSHLAYERKYVALDGAENYGEAINAVLSMLSNIENSPDQRIRGLRENYTHPHMTIAAIERAIHEIFKLCPLVLIDVTTGQLCDAQERARIFKSETPFQKLVSESAIREINDKRILPAVARYFEWIMFSHTWEGQEPTFQDVNLVDSIWNLDGSPLNEKLRQFCMTVRGSGHRWAWSDTCCIDKSTSAILSQSLISMYTWYEEAAATLVFLADVLPLSQLGESRWMTRAWTLQELLASRVIRFYDHEWKPYLNDMRTNHKESPAIKQELAHFMGVTPETINSFRPGDLGVREKLRLASTRNATMEEDIAYSLIGIFSSDIVPRYGLGKTALGHLLEDIIARTGDVTVIAWTGKSMSYNSALPASLAVYSQVPYVPPPMDANELDVRVQQLRNRLTPKEVLAFYDQIIQLPRATFSNRCLQLPCIAFPVTKIGVQELGGDQARGILYRAMVSLLGKVEFRTMDVVPLNKPRNLVFVHPWLRDLADPDDGFATDDEPESESDASSEGAVEIESSSGHSNDGGYAPPSPLHAKPSARTDRCTQALQLIARLGREFNALLLEKESNSKYYKRVAAEHEIIVPGVPEADLKKRPRVKVLEVI